MNTAFPKKRRMFAGVFLACTLVSVALIPLFFAPTRVAAFGGVGLGVPVADGANTAQSAVTAGKSTASLLVQGRQLVQDSLNTAKLYAAHLKEWVGDPMVNYIAKTTLRAITQSIVNWINNDFHGSPSFVTNPEGFLGGIANKVIGRTIQAIDPLWCEPFRLNLRLAFGIGYGLNTAEEVGCTLTDVMANVQGAYDSFVGGNFSQGGGWRNWISITGNRQNNAYGSYLTTVNKLDASILTASGKEIKLLDWGQGFKSWRKCVEYDVAGPALPDGSFGDNSAGREGPLTRAGEYTPRKCIKEGPIETPGSIIQNKLSTALDMDLQELAVADEINEIVAALANKMIQKVMTAGLGGASDYVGASYSSSVSAFPGECKPENDPQSPLYVGGANYDPRYNPSAREYNRALAAARQTRCQRTSHQFQLTLDEMSLFNRDGSAKENVIASIRETAGSGAVPASNPVATRVQGEVNAADAQGKTTSGAAGAAVGTPTGPGPREENIAAGKYSENSLTYGSDYITYAASNANNDSDVDFSLSSASVSGTLPWWEVDLGLDRQRNRYDVRELTEVRVARAPSQGSRSDGLFLFLSDARISPTRPFSLSTGMTDAALEQLNASLARDGVSVLRIPTKAAQPGDTAQVLIPPKDSKKRYLRIYQPGSDGYLALAEVRAIGKQARLTAGETVPNSPTFDILFDPLLIELTGVRAGEEIFPRLLMVVPQNRKEVSLRVQLFAEHGSYAGNATPTPITNIFLNFSAALLREGETTPVKTPEFISPATRYGARMYNSELKNLTPRTNANDVLFSGGSDANRSAPVVFAENMPFESNKRAYISLSAVPAVHPTTMYTSYYLTIEAFEGGVVLARTRIDLK